METINEIAGDASNPSLTGPKKGATPERLLLTQKVFFEPRFCDIFMQLHVSDLITIYWSSEVEDEWTRNVIAKHYVSSENIARCVGEMHRAAPSWQVSDYKQLKAMFDRVNWKDGYVTAAAYKLSTDYGETVALVTNNLKDFPQASFDTTNIRRYSMSSYLSNLCAEDGAIFIAELENVEVGSIAAYVCFRKCYFDELRKLVRHRLPPKFISNHSIQ